MLSGGVSSLAGATPWGAGLSALSAIAATPPPSLNTTVATGAVSVGGVNFAPSATSQATTLVLAAAALLGVVLLSRKKRRT